MDGIRLLINEFGPSVYGFIVSKLGQSADADDVYQTVFLRLFEKKPTFRDKKAVRAWLLKTAYNCIMDVFRDRKKTEELKEDVIHTDEPDIFEIISGLDEMYRDVVYLYYQEDLKIKEIAKILDLSEGAVKTRLRRARMMLKEELS